MNATELKAFIRQVSKEKDLDVDVVRDAVEQAIISASKKNLSQFEDARPELDVESGQLKLFVKKTVANIASNPRTQVSLREATKIQAGVKVGDQVEVEIDPAILGRIAAQSARQVVAQKLKDAERNKVTGEYTNKKGEVFTAVVQRFEKRDLIVSLGKGEALLPRNETPPTSHYRVGDRLKVVLVDIDPESKGPVIKVSRNTPQLVSKLFEQEVPEIADGTVKIVNVVREPGARTKIAVQSTNSDVDPVGACVGVKGSRVQMIVRELENEKIDIVPFSTNIKQYITAALVPAQIQSINTNEEAKQADVIVKQGNLSLAIGKRGQNAKLAARLTGWKLDIHSEGEEEKMANVDIDHVNRQYLEDFLTQIEWADQNIREAFYQSRFNSVHEIANAHPNDVADTIGVDDQAAEELVEGAREYVEALREMTRTNYGEEDQGGEGEGAAVEDGGGAVEDQAEATDAGEESETATAEGEEDQARV